ncbi:MULTISPECIES: hypothetical protein [Methylomonas]|uniref:Uncharacterized protein n=2 Tax=Methylomonas TaxID=416 RepID=A0A140E639_9GAMM|nr:MULTISPECIES: hypothetical protein [Methylomonas]AMK78863.1 hypothetical protein JT25_020645 [Methylomonas denitrificans]OAI02137.1 hypothetical protein A1342_02575 [Methylomonas methanica]TCV78273.1 hypothetical protein EDE11_12448 [Methylomonas methanica]
MKAYDFSFLKNSKTISAITGGLLVFCALNVVAAAAPQSDSFDAPSALILTPSDPALTADATHSTNLLLSNSARGTANQQPTEKRKSRPVNLGCGVDVNQFASEDNSLSSRLVGACDLKFRY